ncbi:putative transporter [Carbonactinospora thermoautotrophica]|uniref:Putative transporter n=1 Tax=Carbonactinospora thermoautotrophica TaxID=1469144 RepID=A0A132MWJ2_9ACTN|nr:MFS transporter [Carbonactinospora thermoautotrophica]KWX02184.1 putative transporter [Carbonactinospora thermoautotrophica]
MRRAVALAALCLSILVVGLDATILNVALPTIAGSLHASTAELQWIVDAYVLALAAGMLPAGAAGDRYGRKRLLLAGLVVFGISSVWSAAADSPAELIAARAVMGVGAAIVMPLVMAFVPVLFGERERPRAIAVMTAAMGAGLPLGPIAGGYLLEHYTWGAVFLVNVPVIGLALPVAALLLPESRNPRPPCLDLVGAVTGTTGLVGVVYGTVQAPVAGWDDPEVLATLGGGLLLLAGFGWWIRRARDPLVSPALFADQGFTWATVATVTVQFALYGVLFVTPLYLQAVHGHDPLGTGLRLTPLLAALFVGAPLSQVLDRRTGTKVTVALGLALLAGGLGLLARVDATSGYGEVAAALAGIGLGLGVAMAPAMDAVVGGLPDQHTGVGAAVNNALRQVGGAFGVAVLGSLLSEVYASRLDPALQGMPAPLTGAARESVTAALAVAGQLGPAGGTALRAAAAQAFTDALSAVALTCALVAVAGVLLTLRFLRRRPAPAPAPAEPAGARG